MEILVLSTTKDKAQAQRIAKAIVEEKLAACVNIIDGIQSIFAWQGKVDETAEALMVIKTQKNIFEKLEKRIKALHSYDVPEIIALDITAGHKPYLDWVRESTS